MCSLKWADRVSIRIFGLTLAGELWVSDGRFVRQAVGELATPDNESARRDVEFGGDFGIGNAARAQGDELFDNFGSFRVHKLSECGR